MSQLNPLVWGYPAQKNPELLLVAHVQQFMIYFSARFDCKNKRKLE